MNQSHTIEDLFRHALALHQSGQLARAEEIYARLGKAVGPNPDLLHLHGTLLFQTGRAAEGRRLIARALILRPDAPGYYDHLGSASRALGDRPGALANFRRALFLGPCNETSTFNAAVILEEIGDPESAAIFGVRSILLQPAAALAWLRLGSALRGLRKFDLARRTLVRSQIVAPENIEAYFLLKEILAEAGNISASDLATKRGILLAPARHEFYANFRSGDISDISNWVNTTPKRYATILKPGSATTWDQLAAEEYSNLAYEKAGRAATRAILLSPDSAKPYNSAGTALFHQGRHREAIRASERALAIDPAFSDTEYNICTSALCLGDLDLAWRHWESRLSMTKSPARKGLPERWNPAMGKPRHLLVASEQGIGDDILFLSCLPDLLRLTGATTIETDIRLHAMLSRSFPGIGLIDKQLRAAPDGGAVHDYTEVVRTDEYSHAAFSGDLPSWFRRDLDGTSSGAGYLKADADERDHWTGWLESLGKGPYLGLSWRSGTLVTPHRATGYLTPGELVSQFPSDSFTLINLQYGDAGQELERLREESGIRIHNPPDLDQIRELDRVLALMTCLDLITTPATTVKALAGASGIPTISLDKSNFSCGDGFDPMFANIYPVKHPQEPTVIGDRPERFGRAIRHFLDHGTLPIKTR